MSPADRHDNDARKRAVDRMADKESKELVDNYLPQTEITYASVQEYMRLVAHKAVEQDRRWRARRGLK